jgi:hypothetical protein
LIGALLGYPQPATPGRYAHLNDDPLRQGHWAVEIRGKNPTPQKYFLVATGSPFFLKAKNRRNTSG